MKTRPGAHALGLTASDLASQLRTAFFGATAGEIQVGREDFEVDVRLADVDRRSAIDGFRVTLPGGLQVPLGAVAEVDLARGYARIARLDRQRAATVTGDVDTDRTNTNVLLTRFQADLLPRLEAEGLRVSLEGEVKEGGVTQRSMQQALLIGLIGIFGLLSFHFRSYLEPVTVMLAIPLALIGVLGGHLLLGLPFTMPSMLGFASLAGVVVNDSILLVEAIKRRRREGVGVLDAARGASRDRFRAVLLTSLTTIVGLLPLLAETSLQAQFLKPLAASIVFGMFASTVLVLVVIPSFYAILGDLGWATRES
jgi:multidrug efflux pump subunit AcrB